MPIVNPKPSAPPIEKPITVQITAPAYKGVVVDTRYEPAASLMTHVEGSSWTVNYYSQVLNEDSALAGQNVTRNAIYQQYTLIKGFELKVTAPLDSNQDEATKSLVITGTANVYPFVIPNEGDMFLADIGDGREGLFKVTVTQRKSIFKEAIYVIEYQMIDYASQVRRDDLNAKVIKTTRFVRDFIEHGQNPLVQEDEFNDLAELKNEYDDMLQRYTRLFLNNEFKTLILPGQEKPIYDHFLTKAFTSYFSTYSTPEVRHIRLMNCDGDEIMKTTNLWDVLTNQNKKLLKHCSFRAGLVHAKTFEPNPVMESIYYSGIKYVVYPKDSELSSGFGVTALNKQLLDQNIVNQDSQVHTLSDLLSIVSFAGLTQDNSPPIHSVTKDDYYIFSKAFYENAPLGQSKLELSVKDYLDGKAPDIKRLLSYCQTYHAWGALERFYYVPIILILIRASIRSV